MTTFKLQQILRRTERNRAEPAEKAQPAGDLASAISQLIAEQVEARVSEALERQRDRLQPTGPRLQSLMRTPAPSSEPAPRTPAPSMPKDLTALIHRDAKGRAAWIEIGGLRFDVQRNELGRITRMVQREESPVLPPLEIPFKASAREYNPGEPR